MGMETKFYNSFAIFSLVFVQEKFIHSRCFPFLIMEISCSICQDPLVSNKDSVATKCGHLFHKTCVSDWLARNTTCPTCRTYCTPTTLIRIYPTSTTATTKNMLVKSLIENSSLARMKIASCENELSEMKAADSAKNKKIWTLQCDLNTANQKKA